MYTAEYVSGETQWGFPTTHTGKNIFLNGQKLLSGENYTDTASGPYIWRNTLNNQPTGELAFAPRGNFDARIQNSSTSLTTLADGYVTEQGWFNGQRLKRNKDYLLISENSLLNQGNLIEYNNRNYFWYINLFHQYIHYPYQQLICFVLVTPMLGGFCIRDCFLLSGLVI